VNQLENRKYLLIFVALVLAGLLCYFIFRIGRSKTSENFPSFVERLVIVKRVIDGDTIELNNGERVRLVGINAPELYHDPPEPGGLEAKEFLENLCLAGSTVGLNVDDMKPHDFYDRTLAVVYVLVDGKWINANAELLKHGFAEILFIPPSEFNPWEWLED